MATHSSILTWEMPQTENPGALVHGVVKSQTHTHTRRAQPSSRTAAGREEAKGAGLLKGPPGESSEAREPARGSGSREPRRGLNTTAVQGTSSG